MPFVGVCNNVLYSIKLLQRAELVRVGRVEESMNAGYNFAMESVEREF